MKPYLQNLFVALAVFACASRVAAQGTVFTYQGQLSAAGAPASGVYDLMFDLYDAATTNGNQLGNVAVPSVPVTNGLFTVLLDFGAQFSGAPRWLQISVQPHGGSGYTALSPLQPILPAPYAITANSASNLLGTVQASQLAGVIANSALPVNPNVSGTVTAGGFSGNGGALTGLNASSLTGTLFPNQLPPTVAFLDAAQTFTGPQTFNEPVVVNNSVGIGVTGPQASLQIAGGVLARGGPPGPFGDLNDGYAFIGNGGDDDSGMFSSANGQIEFYNNAIEAMRVLNGNVGIGITNPTVPLQVNGTVMLGGGGSNYAASGTENLRIVRGIISPTETIAAGSGFTVASNSVGTCTVTFTPSFSGIPSVTCSAGSAECYWNNLGTYTCSFTALSLGTSTPVSTYLNFIAIGPP